MINLSILFYFTLNESITILPFSLSSSRRYMVEVKTDWGRAKRVANAVHRRIKDGVSY